jgi:hypothetical protein
VRKLALFGFTIVLAAFSAPRPIHAQVQQPSVVIRDGGTREVLESIFIPPIPPAPFSLTLDTEWTRPMANGGTYTLVNERHILRDSAGRIYEERWLLVPKGGKMKSEMNMIQVADPVQHTLYNCFTAERQCNLLRYSGSSTASYKPSLATSGPLPDGNGFRTNENLGASTVAGMDTTGYRETTTLNPGVYGNDQPMVTTREFWYSAALRINLLSTLDSPQSGRQKFTVTQVSTSEPEPQWFQIPEGYKVVDKRTTAPAQE